MTSTTNERRHPGTRVLAWAVLLAAVLQVVAPIVTANGPGSSPGEGSGPELLITPVGWAFAIWGVIYALAIAQAIATLVRGPAEVPRRLQIDLLALYLGGALWIVLAGLDSSLATAAALLVMLAAAVDAVITTARSAAIGAPAVGSPAGGPEAVGGSPRREWFIVLTRTAVGLYAGWVTAAAFLNVSTALVDAEVVEADVLGWQLGVLVAAVVFLLVVLVAVRGLVSYAAAGAWALLGIGVTGASNDDTAVVVTAIAGGVVLAVATVALSATERRTAGS